MAGGLARFVEAQDSGGTYAAALAELRAGRKRSHWMWFVLPQVVGLGAEPDGGALRGRRGGGGTGLPGAPGGAPAGRVLREALLGLPGSDPVVVLRGIDAMKLRSSMTLFAQAAGGGGRGGGREGGVRGGAREVL